MSASAADLAYPKVRWNLDALYSGIDDPKVDLAWAEAGRRADSFAERYRGKVAVLSATEMEACIRELENLCQEMSKPENYAGLRFAVEADNAQITAFMQKQSEKATEIRVKLIFFEIELQKVPEEKAKLLLADPALANYHHYIQRVRQATPFTLSEKEEAILEETANTGVRAWVRLFEEVFAQHEFDYTDPVTKEEKQLTESEILDLLRDPSREVRAAAADSFSAGLETLSHITTFIFNHILLDKRIDDRLRARPYPEHSRHMDNELEKETVDLVMRLCKEQQDLVARYYRVKRQILGLPELTHVDRYAPLFDTKEHFSWDDAREVVVDSFSKFSTEMGKRADEFFEKSWIDAEPRQGKTGGAFCSYVTPDLHPVVMLSYHNKMDNVMTLAHELGHGVHASLSRAQTLLNFHGSLPLAELASVFGEQLVFERLVKEASEHDQLALYAEKIEGAFATVFRQAAMFRFEQRCHELRRAEGELSREQIGAIWQEELQGMFGDSVKMGEQHHMWWSYVGHFIFAPFYVYAYSFGELLTLSLYRMAQEQGPSFEADYIEMLRLGGSKSPKDLVAGVGVDLNQPEFWLGGFTAIEQMIERFEQLWAARECSSA